MDVDAFDNDAEGTTEADYSAFVTWLSERTAAELRQAKGDPFVEKQALCRYYQRGERAHLTPGELIDFLAVSTPCILDDANYSDAEAESLMQISDSLTEEDINSILLPQLP